MTAEGTFPKVDGDLLYSSEVNGIIDLGMRFSSENRVINGIDGDPFSITTCTSQRGTNDFFPDEGSDYFVDIVGYWYYSADEDVWKTVGDTYNDVDDSSFDTNLWTETQTGDTNVAVAVSEDTEKFRLECQTEDAGNNQGTNSVISDNSSTQWCTLVKISGEGGSGTAKVQISDGTNHVDLISVNVGNLSSEVYCVHAYIDGTTVYYSNNSGAYSNASVAALSGTYKLRFLVDYDDSSSPADSRYGILDVYRVSYGWTTTNNLLESDSLNTASSNINYMMGVLHPNSTVPTNGTLSFDFSADDGSNYDTNNSYNQISKVTTPGTTPKIKLRANITSGTENITIKGIGVLSLNSIKR